MVLQVAQCQRSAQLGCETLPQAHDALRAASVICTFAVCADGQPPAGKSVLADKSRPVYTPERRRNLSEAIKAKWQDPEYRGKILSALRNPAYQDKRVAAQRVREGLILGHALSPAEGVRASVRAAASSYSLTVACKASATYRICVAMTHEANRAANHLAEDAHALPTPCVIMTAWAACRVSAHPVQQPKSGHDADS